MNPKIEILTHQIIETMRGIIPLYDKILQITLSLDGIAVDDNIDTFGTSLEERQELMMRIDTATVPISEWKAEICNLAEIKDFDLEKLSQHLSEHIRQELAAEFGRVEKTIQEIRKRDEKLKDLVALSKNETELALQRLHSGTKARNAYTKKAVPEPRFIDGEK